MWLIFYLLAFTNVSAAWIVSDEYPDNVKPLRDHRVFRVDNQYLARADELLAGKPYKLLSAEELGILFPGRAFSAGAMINHEIELTVKYAVENENSLKKPFYTNDKERVDHLTKVAQLHRKHAAYLERVKKDVRPYLVSTEACDDNQTYGGVLDIDIGKVSLIHICYVPQKVPVKRAAAVVFSEVPIQTVESKANVHPPWVRDESRKHDAEGFELD